MIIAESPSMNGTELKDAQRIIDNATSPETAAAYGFTPREYAVQPDTPGIYENIPEAAYRAWPAINVSQLQTMARKSPLHLRHELDNPTPPTEAQVIGTALHTAVLEPERWAAEYAAEPKCDKRTTAGKQAAADFAAANVGKTVLKADDYERVQAMAISLYAHPKACELLMASTVGKREVALLWDDEITGLRCKARVDAVFPAALALAHIGHTVIDIKTTDDASPEGFARAIANYKYHLQAAHYLGGALALELNPCEFWFVVVEKQPPHAVACYQLAISAVAQGEHELLALLETYEHCQTYGEWPGYQESVIDLPRWAQNDNGRAR